MPQNSYPKNSNRYLTCNRQIRIHHQVPEIFLRTISNFHNHRTQDKALPYTQTYLQTDIPHFQLRKTFSELIHPYPEDKNNNPRYKAQMLVLNSLQAKFFS